VPASYHPVWIPFNKRIRRVMRAAACDEREAIKGVVAACRDGAVKSRYGDTHEAIEPVSWVRAAIRKGHRAEAREYVLIAIVPRQGEIYVAPREMLGRPRAMTACLAWIAPGAIGPSSYVARP
jgi:hypothetical protein